MAAHGFALVAGLLLALTKQGDWEIPRSAPSPARSLPGFVRDPGEIGQLMGEVRADIRMGRRSGQLSHEQARSLRRQANAIDALQARYVQDGLTDSEAMDLENQLEALRSIATAPGPATQSK